MRPAQPVLGVALIVGSVFLMSFGDALIKYNSASFTAWQIFSLRSLIVLPVLVALMLLLAPGESLLPKSPGWVGLRSALLVLMWIAYYAALPLISLSAAAVAFYTAPLFMALLSRPLTGEPVGTARWLGIGLGFLGVLIVLRPGGDTFSVAALLPVLAAILYALAAIITRARCAEERPLVLAFGLNIGLLAAGLIATAGLWLIQPSVGERVGASLSVRPVGCHGRGRLGADGPAGAADGGVRHRRRHGLPDRARGGDRDLRLHLRLVRGDLELCSLRRAPGRRRGRRTAVDRRSRHSGRRATS